MLLSSELVRIKIRSRDGEAIESKESYRFNQCALQNVETERMNSEIPGKIITENTRSVTAYFFCSSIIFKVPF